MKTEITVRPLHTHAECETCVAIQAATWGGDPTGFTSAALLLATQHTGGVVSGAFTRDGEVVGFVYSYVANSEGRFYHWSHQLAVLPAYQGKGIARQLKVHQRQLVREDGMNLIAWTFDPMMSINAHFNLNKLGAVCRMYRRNAYGPMNDEINKGLPSDRFNCLWHLDDPRNEVALNDLLPTFTVAMWQKAGATLMNPSQGLKPPTTTTLPEGVHALLVAIPTDFVAMKKADIEQAKAWQGNVRLCFEAAFRAGYEARRFVRGEEKGYYVLLRKGQA